VLVVGSGQSSYHIVEEVQALGRGVYLSIGHTGRAPMRYCGRHMSAWADTIGAAAVEVV
jgi:putative flavoprotein involved in K+ transport